MAEPAPLKLTAKQHELIYVHQDVDEIFYGGAAGGAKSEGLLRFALRRRIECPGSVGLMLRRTFPELDKSLIRKSHKIYGPYAKWKEAKRHWLFHKHFGGSIQEFGYVEADRDVEQFQSAEYDDICFDELGHFNEYPYVYLMSRLRPRAPTPGLKDADGNLVKPWKGLMRSAGNPGGIGHQWIKARFIPYRDKVLKDYDPEEGTYKTRLFIPAKLGDNTAMSLAERKQYRAWLNMLPETERRMLRDGDWDFTPGAAFSELTRDKHGYDPEEIPTPKWAPILMSFDFGFGKPFSVGWWWVDYDGRLWRFAEWYGWNGKTDTGLRLPLSEVAQGILKREKFMGIDPERVINRPSDPSVFAKKPNYKGGGLGASIADIMGESGVYLTPSDNDRLLGKQQFHERLRVPEEPDERPLVMISNKCAQFWRTVPSVPLLHEGPHAYEDVDTKSEDHVYDEARYCFMSRPVTPESRKPPDTEVEKIIKRIVTPEEQTDEMLETFDL